MKLIDAEKYSRAMIDYFVDKIEKKEIGNRYLGVQCRFTKNFKGTG